MFNYSWYICIRKNILLEQERKKSFKYNTLGTIPHYKLFLSKIVDLRLVSPHTCLHTANQHTCCLPPAISLVISTLVSLPDCFSAVLTPDGSCLPVSHLHLQPQTNCIISGQTSCFCETCPVFTSRPIWISKLLNAHTHSLSQKSVNPVKYWSAI